ncbi:MULTISPECIES: CHAP domain-containing protein [unclassified Cytobacillus]|uniref:CHAP domain-containing protein n=1 Tax=unclassified Cytobacillus TaxID=2675268 RepID=UPI0020404765|nr:CHAP domain-containing protein [Cytobacillus sp. AMY 15.2]MCM3090916.1 CHAP domain-containing protein [Cytobacillus sp. AMY 15.2]
MTDVSIVIEIAKAEVGYLEKASNRDLDDKTANAGVNNFTKYARDLDAISGFYIGEKQGYAWCDVFVDWCFVQAYGVEEAKKLLCHGERGASCAHSALYFKNNGQYYTSGPKIGDQIFFGSNIQCVSHTGIVYAVDSTYVYTIEGNTFGASSEISNGGGVSKKFYTLSNQKIAGYGRPNYNI